MSKRRIKITIDIFMSVFLALSFVRWIGTGGAAFHFIVGCICSGFFAAHVFIHRKWYIAAAGAHSKGKLNRKMHLHYVINCALAGVWGLAILTGFVAIVPFFMDVDFLAGVGRAHGMFARAGLLLMVIHIIQHLPQILGYFGIKRSVKPKLNV